MAQVNKNITLKRLGAGAGVLAAAAFCANLIFGSATATQLDSQALRSITTESAFKTIQGDGSRAVHVFLSTDCSFCKKIEPELERLENVTIYRHMLPGHTDAGRLAAIAVWCSESPIEAWKAVAAGLAAASAKCDASALDKNLSLARRLGLSMTPSIVYPDGQISAGMLSTGEMGERLSKSPKG